MDDQLLVSPRNSLLLLSDSRSDSTEQHKLVRISEEQSESSEPSSSSSSSAAVWRPTQLVFSPYSQRKSTKSSPSSLSLRVVVRRPVSLSLLASTMKQTNSCFSQFSFLQTFQFMNFAVGGKTNKGHNPNVPNLQSALQLLRRIESKEIPNQPIHWSPQRWM